MIEKPWTSKSGNTGFEYKLEAGDVIVPMYDKPMECKNTTFPKSIIKVMFDGEERIVTLTGAQIGSFERIGDVKDKELYAYSYKSKSGKMCVGISDKKRSDKSDSSNSKPKPLSLAPKPVTELSEKALGMLDGVKGWLETGAEDKDIIFSLQEYELSEAEAKLLLAKAKGE